MKITMYELLGMIKEGKAPKTIKWYDNFYRDYDEISNDYTQFIYQNLENGKWNLNDTVEIIEEEKKIPEKLNIINGAVDGKWKNGKSYNYTLSAPQIVIIHKVNEIIDYLKSKGE